MVSISPVRSSLIHDQAITNKADVSNPESYEDIVELLVPVLQKRGLMWEDYVVAGGTYRENLLSIPGQKTAPEGHPSTQFKYDVLKEKYADENGDITINKEDPVPAVEKIVPATNGLTISEQPIVVKTAA